MKIQKPYTDKEYADLAVYCNEHNSIIKDAGDYLESVKKTPYIPTDDEKATHLRSQRDIYINEIEWRISRYRDQHELEIETSDTAETYIQILQYIQYLRDISATEGFPDIQIKTFDEWVNYQQGETPIEEGGE